MTPHSMREMDALLAAGPAASSWDLVTRLAEDLPATELDALRGRLDAWPRGIRAMPERWWLQRLAGDDRPFHALASHYRPVLDGFVGLGWSGGCTVACSAGGRTVLLSGGFEPHHRGGDVFAWDTADRARRTLLSGKDYHGVTAVAAFTADGATVVAVPSQELMLGTLAAWQVDGPGGDHRPRWRRQLGASVFDEDGEILEEFLDAELESVGLAVCGDGGVVAAAAARAATVLVVDRTGATIAEVGDAATGAVALDGPLIFATGGRQHQPGNNPGAVALVFDGAGRVCWSEPGHHLGGFSPDGTALVTAKVDGENDVTVWFLDRYC